MSIRAEPKLHTRATLAGDDVVRWLVVVPVVLTPLECHAYIDPNAAGWLFQLLFPLLVAIGGAWMVFRQRIGKLWNRLFRRRNVGKEVD